MFGRLAPVLLTGVAVTGCASLVTTQTSYDVVFRSGVPSEFGYAVAGGEMPVVVVGNPFGRPKPEVDRQVIAAMQGKNYGPRVRFVPATGESLRSGYAVVVLLDAVGGASGDAACAWRGRLAPDEGATPEAVPPRQPPAGRTTMFVAFCGNADARSWAYSTTGPVTSPGDPLFRELVARTTFAMLPPRDDEFGDSDFE